MSVLRETIRPRTAAGVISEMYIGETIDTAPTATPRNVRAAASSVAELDSAHHTDPATKISPPAMSVRRRPMLPATRPATSAPTAAPTSSIEVTSPSSWADMPNSGPTKRRAPDITPVS